MRHLLDIPSLTKEWILKIFDTAASFKKEIIVARRQSDRFKGLHAGLLFFEPSTRTKASFHMAASMLGADPVSVEAAFSSVQKGESLQDTVMTLDAMGCHFLIIRHSQDGAASAAARVARQANVINAGDGAHEHPTQALLDAFTMLDKKKRFEDLTVLFLGDELHSRVTNSNLALLKILGARRVIVSGPADLMLPESSRGGAVYVPALDEALAQADVIYVLRPQRERHTEEARGAMSRYREDWGLTRERLARIPRKDFLIFHPGPMNIGLEIDREIADGPNSCVLDQVANGLFVRMAVLDALHLDCRR
ncbi:MAG: aspartate carbamoyltransferase catalytic subunit [Elusimicrobiota bacterium]